VSSQEFGHHRIHQRLEVVDVTHGRSAERVPDVGQFPVLETLESNVYHAFAPCA